jgi:outer membrane protein
MTTARTLTLAPLALGLLLAGTGAAAHEAGDVFIRTGPALVAPNDDSSAVSVNGSKLAGTGVEVDDGYAVGLTVNWMLTEHWGVELLASTPFTHRISGKGLGIDRIGEVTHLPPTVSLQWYPRGGSARLQPYVGLGVNYFMTFSEDVAGEFEAALGDSDLEVHDSVGLAAQVGVDYALTDRWSLNAALWYVDVATEATIETPTAGFEQIEVDVDVDPLAWMLGMTYRF